MNLVIVESPAKAKTIAQFLGNGFIVESSIGHIRDMAKKNMGIDIDNHFKPIYEISPDKKKIVSKLKKIVKQSDTIYLATDEDREGESIAWHLLEALNLPADTPRITFHEITKSAITKAIENPRIINQPLVNAQQARRIIDRLVGFEISPVLWRKISGAKSAGRVQSPVVRLVVERERHIKDFQSSSSFKVQVSLKTLQGEIFSAKLKNNFTTKQSAFEFAQQLLNNNIQVTHIEKKPAKRTPPPPFMTSTLQQEASQKLGFSVKQTMNIAQNLYRDGHISYMRTDSLNLSESALKSAAQLILSDYGKDYLTTRRYKTKMANSQEAHEAIRPTELNKKQLFGIDDKSQKLYQLIRKRTLASQMSVAKLEKTQIHLQVKGQDELLIASGEILKFPGFLSVYNIDNSKDKLLPELNLYDQVFLESYQAKQTWSCPLGRYTEASLVKKIEEMGIGRPSTFATMISAVQERGYVLKGNIAGQEKSCDIISIENKKIKQWTQMETIGNDKNKLHPSSVAYLVIDFLVKYFDNIVDYQWTAKLESDFDKIATQKAIWYEVVGQFYQPFHQKITRAVDIPREELNNARVIGKHPENNKLITARLGRYGAFVQIGNKDDEEKPVFASLKQDQHLDTISLDDALELFKLPREVGQTEDGTLIKANYGRFGPYIQYGQKYVSLKEDIPEEVSLKKSLQLIKEKEAFEATRVIKTFEKSDIQVLNGQFGPYIWNGKKRGKGQKNITVKKVFANKYPKDLTLKDCENAISGKIKPKPKKGKKTK